MLLRLQSLSSQRGTVNHRRLLAYALSLMLAIIFFPAPAVHAQFRQEPGKAIGKVSVMGNAIVLELDEDALGKANMFDLDHHTLRFTPVGGGYKVENVPVQWDSDFGSAISGADVSLKNFKFPFSGKQWDTFSVGDNGSIRFGSVGTDAGAGLGAGDRVRGAFGGRVGGVQIGRFDQLAEAAGAIINTVPAICVFMKPRMLPTTAPDGTRGPGRYAKELADRVVVTWDVTEPWGNIQDFTWKPTVNRFQAVLHKDGSIEMSYNDLTAKDAIVGVYPMVSETNAKTLGSITSKGTAAAPEHLDIRNVSLTSVDAVFLRVNLQTRGPVLAEGDKNLNGIVYRIFFNTQKPITNAVDEEHADAVWTVRGFAGFGRNASPRYFASGPGASRTVKTSGNTISIQGTLPTKLQGAKQVYVSAEAMAPNSQTSAAQIPARAVKLGGIQDPEVHLSSLKPQDGPFPIVYEAFHYYRLPNARDLTCSVLKTLGDKYDFLAYYSDFRIDNQEAGTPSNGPLGSTGPAVTGIHAQQRGLEAFCSAGRFQWQFIQPVYVGANQMYEYPPADAPVGTDHDITGYNKQLGEIFLDGKIPPYMYAMSQIGHEMGHRWGAFVNAKVGNETIPLGPTHWATGLQAPVAFPYRRPTEASAMGGGVWQDNGDGTYTQLDDDYYVPATGWSYLDLYLMGMIAPSEVPDFFILRNLSPVRDGSGAPKRDENGHRIYKGDKTKVTIQDVIAAEGPRTPDVYHSQRAFNTGFVLVVEHGKKPSQELIDRVNGIREQWLQYWPITTGHRSTMTANPQ